MNTTDTTTTDPADTTTEERPADVLLTVALDQVAEHPDNVRRHLGELTDLTRSIRNKGIIVPLLVLPANDNGVHLLVAGHRRIAAALVAWLAEHPDPTALLAALAIGHIESRGTKSSSLTSYGGASDERLGAYIAWLRSNTTIDSTVIASAD